VRVAQLADIQCTNCHTYGARPGEKGESPRKGHHFSVNLTACYTCHFNNEGFNTGTNSCLLCHKQLPTEEIIVHKELTPKQGPVAIAGVGRKTVKMNQAISTASRCASCHGWRRADPRRTSRLRTVSRFAAHFESERTSQRGRRGHPQPYVPQNGPNAGIVTLKSIINYREPGGEPAF
jgi:hypothetical protein